MNETFNVALLTMVRCFGVDYKFSVLHYHRHSDESLNPEGKRMLNAAKHHESCMIAYSIAVGFR